MAVPVPANVRGDLTRSQARTALAWIVLIGAVARIVLWLAFRGVAPQVWDEHDYDRLAVNLVRHHQFAYEPGHPISLRPPLYPAVVAAVYQIAGEGNYPAVRLLQAGLSLLTIVVLYSLGAELESRRVGTWLAGLYAFYPSLLVYNNLLLTEVLFTTLVCATCLALVRSFRRRSIPTLMLGGILLGLAALTRSVLWLFPVALGTALLATWPGNLGGRMRAGGALAVSFAVTMLPWAIRNTRLERTFQAVDCMGGRNFMMGNYDYTPMFRAWDAISEAGERSWARVLNEAVPDASRLTQGQWDKVALRYGLAFAASHPGLTARRDIVKFFNFWGLEREVVSGVSRGHYGTLSTPTVLLLTAILAGSYALALCCGILGVVRSLPRDPTRHGLLLLMISFVCAMHTLTFGHPRYHLPIMPLVLLYAAVTIVHAGEIWRRRRTAAFRLAFGFCAVFVVAWLLEVVVLNRQNALELLGRPG
jgi:4-amino-4-deoxy-L-arabinose transferase-like glycosyltransferase